MQDIQGIKRKTKVCFVVTKGVWGGAQKYVFSLATSLPKNNYEVIVISGEGETLPNKLILAGIQIYRLPEMKRDISLINEIKNFFALYKILKKEKPDVLHLNSPKAGGLGALAGRLLGIKKIVYTAHGWTFNEDRKIFNKIIIFLFSWITVLLCHKTIVIAEKEKRQTRFMPFVKNKIVLIRNGVEQIVFKEKDVARKELLALCGGQTSTETKNNLLWLGTISELHKNKGLEYALSAVSKIMVPFIFFVIGEGEERNRLQKLIEQYNLENKVFLVGFLDNANQYLKAFDIFTLTSIKEGLPYTILEAGSAGLPVIASSVGGIPDIIDSGTNGILVQKTNAPQITKTIEFMIDHPNERKMFGQKLQQRVEKEFSLKQMLEKTLEVYKNPNVKIHK